MSHLLEQSLSPAHITLLTSYVRILSEMTVLDESRAVLLTSPLVFSSLCARLVQNRHLRENTHVAR